MRLAYHVVSAPAPLGLMFLAVSERGVCALRYMDKRSLKRTLQDLAPHWPGAEWVHSVRELRPLADQLDEWFCGTRRSFEWPLDPPGSAFERAAWRTIATIGFGETRSAAQVARMLGQPSQARAIVQACEGNPLAIVVPCHRVLTADGRSPAIGGLPRNKWLHTHEQRFRGLEHPDTNRVIAEATVVVKRPAASAPTPARRRPARTVTARTAVAARPAARPAARAAAPARRTPTVRTKAARSPR
jgi:O-6-methylguanine DNA methyltransferase